jgi:hypothetical protein
MSKVSRLGLAVLVSLGVIIGIYTSAAGATITRQEKAGTHQVSGTMVNLDHFRGANAASAATDFNFKEGKGHGCESDTHTSPDD